MLWLQVATHSGRWVELHSSFCVLAFRETECVLIVQRQFRGNDRRGRPSKESILR